MKNIIMLMALLNIATFAQGTFTDSRDGKTYKTVKIGNQTWMAQNLDYHGEDGFLGLCYGDEPKKKIRKLENCKKYGRLYDWNEAIKACPKGWHLPSDKEWQTLVDFAGGKDVAGKKLKAKTGWNNECKWNETDNRGRVTVIDHCGSDEYGFSALPGGGGTPDGSFVAVGINGGWWSASKYYTDFAYGWYMGYGFSEVGKYNVVKSNLLSVRCVKD
ncbi:MAG: fibrobacter succinogenes major paralogous domain-containing protein [Fibromonadales bacterium]|nr:fibrobacter succinogenes major paralogous domain-containing protein [Fibromonadales bacterium]